LALFEIRFYDKLINDCKTFNFGMRIGFVGIRASISYNFIFLIHILTRIDSKGSVHRLLKTSRFHILFSANCVGMDSVRVCLACRAELDLLAH